MQLFAFANCEAQPSQRPEEVPPSGSLIPLRYHQNLQSSNDFNTTICRKPCTAAQAQPHTSLLPLLPCLPTPPTNALRCTSITSGLMSRYDATVESSMSPAATNCARGSVLSGELLIVAAGGKMICEGQKRSRFCTKNSFLCPNFSLKVTARLSALGTWRSPPFSPCVWAWGRPWPRR